jgi:predicted RNA-binding Zn-ribbon protein involved in translation (DUF1610 family)
MSVKFNATPFAIDPENGMFICYCGNEACEKLTNSYVCENCITSFKPVEKYGFFLLGKDARTEIFHEDYEKFKNGSSLYGSFIGIFIFDDTSDKTKAKFWKECYSFAKRYCFEGLSDCVRLLFIKNEEEVEIEGSKCGECGVSTQGRKIRSLWNNALCEECGEESEEESTAQPLFRE